MKKLCILFIILLFCVSSLTSCLVVVKDKTGKGNASNSDSTSTDGETTGINYPPPLADILDTDETAVKKAFDAILPDKDFGGKVFTVIMVDDIETNISSEDGTTYTRAVSKRYELLKNELNCEMQITKVDEDTFLTEAKTAASAGLYYGDIACVPQRMVGFLHLYGIALDLNTSFGDVFTGDSYLGDAKEQTSGANSFYAVSGYGSLSLDTYGCVYFNKNITDSYGITGQLYETFENGSWTWDKMAEFKAVCNGSEYADSVMLGTENDDMLIEGAFTSSGMKFMTTGLGVQPAAADNGDRVNGLITRLKGMIADSAVYVSGENTRGNFEQGKVLFYIDTLDKAPLLKCEFGILPIPKLDAEQQSYKTYATPNSRVMLVLKTNSDHNAASDFLRAYNEASLLLKDAWLADLLDYVLCDEMSYKVIENMLKNLSFDFGYMYGPSSIPVANSSYSTLKRAVLQRYDFNNVVASNKWRIISEMRTLFRQ